MEWMRKITGENRQTMIFGTVKFAVGVMKIVMNALMRWRNEAYSKS
jgi:hypothetical protein